MENERRNKWRGELKSPFAIFSRNECPSGNGQAVNLGVKSGSISKRSPLRSQGGPGLTVFRKRVIIAKAIAAADLHHEVA